MMAEKLSADQITRLREALTRECSVASVHVEASLRFAVKLGDREATADLLNVLRTLSDQIDPPDIAAEEDEYEKN